MRIAQAREGGWLERCLGDAARRRRIGSGRGYNINSKPMLDPRRAPDPFATEDISFVLSSSITSRIVTQGGLFSVHGSPNRPWQEPFADPTHLFEIPGEFRAFFKRRLFYFGLDAQRIKGGLDGLGERLAWQYNAAIGLGAVR